MVVLGGYKLLKCSLHKQNIAQLFFEAGVINKQPHGKHIDSLALISQQPVLSYQAPLICNLLQERSWGGSLLENWAAVAERLPESGGRVDVKRETSKVGNGK